MICAHFLSDAKNLEEEVRWGAWEGTKTVQEVMLKAVSGELNWFHAADILGWPPWTLRR